ncbi:Na+:H+ antiporter, NhaA family [Palleronia salina]|uniref:Putative Na(+)/H(+) antiporter NhaA homolog n=1 Tax=Palleronia salina TaxID=313368 RepID=A0A1M6GD37_9RHOB|nr:Na+/H+ antiporter NhaA [Palleronia salina]SHJ07853.1 Na+:H+ antiporter, NhaA family [Palleronia salina]
MYRVWNHVPTYLGLLLVGTAVALTWAQLDAGSYDRVTAYPLLFNGLVGQDATVWLQTSGAAFGVIELGDVTRVLTPRSLVNDALMALFFFIAGKEVWEASVLDHGALRGGGAHLPLVMTLGGMAVPALVFLGLSWLLLGPIGAAAVAPGWVVPISTDLALSFVVARAIFGAGHPALRLLLLIALMDDAVAMAVLAAVSNPPEMAPGWLLLSVAAAGTAWLTCNWLPRRLDRGNDLQPAANALRRRLGLWPYALAGLVSWFAFARAGVAPALGLLPIIPALPHADRAFGIYASAEKYLHDPLNEAAHRLMRPAQAALLAFGLVNMGVVLSDATALSGLVLAGFVLGKPLGLGLACLLALGVLRMRLPGGIDRRTLAVLCVVAGCGITLPVALSDAVFAGPTLRDAAVLGALGSLVTAPLAWVLARALGLAPQR